ncbi:SWIM zinc finger family protein [Actinosynnema sp. NPDC047251]|nr:SWIM zinc finger family protein [Saccharothrix espanaensis]
MRADLLALTPDALGALANRGLVKRATKELDAGTGPEVEVAGDGTVTGRFPDGVESTLPPDVALDAARCTCGAPGVCRHRIAVVLAYQRTGESAAFTAWSPGAVTDEALTALVGDRVLAAARRAQRAGYPVKLTRPSAEDPVATAELPSCTVKFLVPDDLGYVHTDAVAAKRDEVLVLAVWAFREADERGLTGPRPQFDVGGAPGPAADLAPALDLAGRLLRDGAVHTTPVLDAALRRVRADLVAAGLHWPAAAVDDLAEQIDAYRQRSARHHPQRAAELITELYARHRATGRRSQVLGTDEAAETPLRRVRLTALGCRVRGGEDERTAEVFFADEASVLVLRHRWPVGEDEHPTGHDLAGRRLAGSTLGALAASTVVSESAARSASRVVRLTSNRVSQTSITPVGRSWARLPATVLEQDLAAVAEALRDLPPRLVRPRIEAETVRVVRIGEVRRIGYDPGAQRLDVEIADPHGHPATVSAVHRGVSPAALDVLATALADEPTHLSGALRRVRGGLVIDPIAVLTAQGVVVPDLAAGGAATLDGPGWDRPDPITAAVDDALSATAEAAHRGLDHLPDSIRTRLFDAVAGLRRVGLTTAAATLDALATTPDQETWLTAQFHLLTTAELR